MMQNGRRRKEDTGKKGDVEKTSSGQTKWTASKDFLMVGQYLYNENQTGKPTTTSSSSLLSVNSASSSVISSSSSSSVGYTGLK